MITKSRKVVALGLTIALVAAGIALADGASENVAAVDGKVTPSKLDNKKFKPVNLFLGVRNSSEQIDGAQSNPASERISFSKNVKINLKKAPKCTAALANGSTTGFARDACPAKSYLGSGDAEVKAPTAACGPGATEPCVVAEPVVSVFNGPGNNQLRLHTYSPDLGPASPIVNASIINSSETGYGKALWVPSAPATGAIMITKFNAKLMKSRKVVTARCKPKSIKYLREVTYDDASSEKVTKKQKCTVRR